MKKSIGTGVFLLLLLIFGESASLYAKENKTDTDWQNMISLENVQQAFEDINESEPQFSLTEYVQSVMDGKTEFSAAKIGNSLWEQITGQFEKQKESLFRILALGILAGIFVNFSGTVGDKELGETGFYITYLLLFALMSTGFYTAYSVAEQAMENLILFMKALIPSFSMSLCIGAGTTTSLAYYESMLIAIALIEMAMKNVFLPGVQVYFLFSVINQLAENRFSKMVELIHSFLRFGRKLLFGVLIGYQGVQGILLPVMDRVKNNTLWQTAKGIPGIGNTVGSMADTLLGSGLLIKSALGAGALICLLLLCFYPLAKIFVFMAVYRLGSAAVQPVSDKRVAAGLSAAAESGSLLMGFLFAGVLMFFLSIVIVLVCTNMV